jgi:hypothetical protein
MSTQDYETISKGMRGAGVTAISMVWTVLPRAQWCSTVHLKCHASGEKFEIAMIAQPFGGTQPVDVEAAYDDNP